jgi:two-component system, response regulator
MLTPILLVEDNPDDIDLTRDAFERNQITNPIHVATDGAEALDYLFGRGRYSGALQPELPCVMLLDLNLPKIPGLDVLRAIRADERTKLLPTVVLTTSIQEQDVLRSYGLGANAYVQKPVGFDDFVKAVGRLGLFWTLSNVSPPVR